jgi:hypothetical protein
MAAKANALKLNALQLRTLALAQVMAAQPDIGHKDEASGTVTLMSLPSPHGNHFHVGPYTVSMKDASGLFNAAVWKVLERKGLARTDGPGPVTLTAAGMAYVTGLEEKFQASDH